MPRRHIHREVVRLAVVQVLEAHRLDKRATRGQRRRPVTCSSAGHADQHVTGR
jgi:hypothetical protein